MPRRLALLLVLGSVRALARDTVVLPITSDTSIVGRTAIASQPDASYEGARVLEASGTPLHSAVLLRWDLSALDAGVVVSRARLDLTAVEGTLDAYRVHALLAPWTAAEASWLGASAGTAWPPGASGAARGPPIASVSGASGHVITDLGDAGVVLVTGWLSNAAANYGVVIDGPANADALSIAASEYSDATRRPMLEITYRWPASMLDTTVSFTAVSDTTIADALDPRSTAFDGRGLRCTGGGFPDRAAAALVRFDVSSLPPWTMIEFVELHLNVVLAPVSAYPVSVFAAQKPWSAPAATFLTIDGSMPWSAPGASGAGDLGTAAYATFTPAALGPDSVMLSSAGNALVQSWLSGSVRNDGLFLGEYSSAGEVWFSDADDSNTANRPDVTLELIEGELRFVTAAQVLAPGETSAPIQLERVSVTSVPVGPAATALSVTVQSSSPSAELSSDGVCWAPALSVDMATGVVRSPLFYARDGDAGASILNATGNLRWDSASQTETITSGPCTGARCAPPACAGYCDGGRCVTDAGPAPDAGERPDGGTQTPQAGSLVVGCSQAPGSQLLVLLVLGLRAWLAGRRRG